MCGGGEEMAVVSPDFMESALDAEINPAGSHFVTRARVVRYPQSMGAKTAISLEQYLRTIFPDVDREYRDGEIVERSLPDYLHGRVQGAIFAFFWALRSELAL